MPPLVVATQPTEPVVRRFRTAARAAALTTPVETVVGLAERRAALPGLAAQQAAEPSAAPAESSRREAGLAAAGGRTRAATQVRTRAWTLRQAVLPGCRSREAPARDPRAAATGNRTAADILLRPGA